MFESHRKDRRGFLKNGCTVASYTALCNMAFPAGALADEGEGEEQILPPELANPVGQREILKGLDGMSRVAEKGNNPFRNGHRAAAVMAAGFYCREQKIVGETQQEIVGFVEKKLLNHRIYAPRPEEKADASLVDGLVKDLDAGIGELRHSGHNIIFAVLSLQALQAVPEAATPERIDGLRQMAKSLGTTDATEAKKGEQDDTKLFDLSDEKKFVAFIFEEYLDALDLYLNGKGHHGFAGHCLTVGHALLTLKRLGHVKTAEKGVAAYWGFVRVARSGARRGGKRVADGPKLAPTPLDRNYWKQKVEQRSREIVSSHLIKYPYSFYALAKEIDDPELKTRILENLYHLSAIT